MSKRRWGTLLAGFTAAVAVLLVIGLTVNSGNGNADTNGAGKNSKANDGQYIILTGGGCDKTQVASMALQNQGFAPDQFKTGEDNIDWSKAVATKHGAGSFTTPKKTTEEWTAWLNSNDPNAALVKKQVAQEAGVTELDPKGWIAFQITVPSDWGGNTSVSDGKVKSAGTRHSDAGDAGWLYVNLADCQKLITTAQQATTNGQAATITPAEMVTKVRTGAVRLGCGNPQTQLPTPNVPPPPPGQTSPPNTTTKTTPPTTGLTPKDPTKNIDRNPNVPPQVIKTGPSPDNQSEIDKGPQAPIETPNGCQGTCTTTQPQPPPVHNAPSCGQPGQPSCSPSPNNTTPPTVAPPVTIPGSDNGHIDIDP